MQPDVRLVTPIEWRKRDDGTLDLLDPAAKRWHHYNSWVAPILEGLARAQPLDSLVAHVPGEKARAPWRLRRLVYSLAQMGYLDIVVERPDVFAGRYRVEKELGRGGVGIAYLCRDESGERVVVKRAWDFVQPYDATERAMRNEAQVLRRLRHPGIVRLLGEFEADGHLHLVREYVDGAPIDRYQGAPLASRARRLHLVASVAQLLGALHEAGYLLVDLRPANFFEAGDRLVLIDVGTCQPMVGGAVAFEHHTGSPGFTSPEMRLAKRLTPRSDLWGLGRLDAFLATGEMPPKEDTLAPLLARLPAEEAPLVARLSADEPSERPASVAEALRLISSFGTRG